MQKSLRSWRVAAIALVWCLNSYLANGQLSYTFTAVTGTYSTLNSPTGLIGSTVDDALSSATNIGFNFTFGCTTYTQFKASSNGWISLGSNTLQTMPTNDLEILGNGPILAPLWDDLKSASSSINYLLSGSAPNRVLTIEWNSMRWNKDADGRVISFQLKLYETTNVIEFRYSRNGTDVENGSASIGIAGGYATGDFYSLNGTGGSPTANYGTETSNLSQKPATDQVYRWTPNNMTYVSSTTTQVTQNVSKCNELQQPVIRISIVTKGCNAPLNLTQLQVDMNNTTTISDVSNVRIYYTGDASSFSPINQFGSNITPASGTITVNASQTLTGGTNYFWVTYDLNSSATIGNVLDGRFIQSTVGGSNYTPTTSSPSSNRSITGCSVAPGGINNMSFWVKGNAGTSSTTHNTKINQWSDQSGNSRHATQSVDDNRPTYYNDSANNLNFNPVVDFNEAAQDEDLADFMDITGNGAMSTGNNGYEVYAVIIPGAYNLTKPGKFLFAGEFGANTFNSFDVRSNYSLNDSWSINDQIITSQWSTNNSSLLTFDYNSFTREMFNAGTSLGTKTTTVRRVSPDLNNALACQRSVTPHIEFYDGRIAEIITYANTSHGTTARQKVESYLAIKYGTTLSHNYYSANGVKVWDIATNASYNNNIIGIAKDDNSGLSQKQSKSTSLIKDILTVYIGTTKTVNQASNTGTFATADKTFFMVGSNGAAASDATPSTTEKPSGICCRLMREWMIQMTSFTNTTVKLEFDFNSITAGYLPLNAADLRLLVDADGNFGNATILTSPTITINAAAGVATVTVPLSSLSGKPYFTLASVSANTLLPIELKRFTGVCKDHETELKWSTDFAAKSGFTIERSGDKTNFATIGIVKANESGNYTWLDEAPLPGVVYYRLKAIAENGSTLYSTVVAVSGCNTNHISFSSNPATGQSILTLQLQQNEEAEINVYDVLGRRFDIPALTGRRSLNRGVYNLPVNIPGATAGMYYLYVQLNGEKQVFRVLKNK
jgi:hypothetical protein